MNIEPDTRVRLTERVAGRAAIGMEIELVFFEVGTICVVACEDDAPNTYVLTPESAPVIDDVERDCELWRVSPIQFEVL